MRVGSWRWWFENRQTGAITIAQFPNWPLFAIAGGWIAQRLAEDGSRVDDGARIAVVALWVYWAGDEVVRGVNPWRRLLGVLVLAWQVSRVLR